jgi:hypothetical protein
MFQQSIPRFFPDSDIATYHWPFILIDDQTGQFRSKAVFIDSSHFLQKFDNLEQKMFWPKICSFGP